MFGCSENSENSENSVVPIHPNILRNNENSAILAIPTKSWNSKRTLSNVQSLFSLF